MSDHFPNHFRNKMWLNNVCHSDQNLLTHIPPPSAFHRYNYSSSSSSSSSVIINRHVTYPRCQQTNYLHTVIWGRETYFRLHGGIGDGRGGIACWNTYENVVARPVQLFDAPNMVDFQVNVPYKKKSPVVAPRKEAMGGTGVFLPVYPNNMTYDAKGNHGGCGRMKGKDIAVRGWMKGKDIVSDKPLMSCDATIVKEEEPKNIDEIPIELLLPAEWPYEVYA